MLIRYEKGSSLSLQQIYTLVKLVLHANIVCGLVASLASQWYHTFQSFSNLHFLDLAIFHSKNEFLNGIYTNLSDSVNFI